MTRIVPNADQLRVIIRPSQSLPVVALRCGATKEATYKQVSRLGEIVGADLRLCFCCREPFLPKSSANAVCPICVATDTADWAA